MIEWKSGVVCHAYSHQWRVGDKVPSTSGGLVEVNLNRFIAIEDFQLNEPSEGYYIPKSELDTEEKYNQVVEVFGLCGYYLTYGSRGFLGLNFIGNDGKQVIGVGIKFGKVLALTRDSSCKVKLTFDQLMAIGELKRKMNECDDELIDAFENTNILSETLNKVGNTKEKEAYRILESMGIEWDNMEGKWFKKEWL